MMKLSIRSIAVAAFLSLGSAQAADLRPLYTKAAPVLNWSGFYIGAHVGTGLQRPSRPSAAPGLVDDNNYLGTGVIAGGQFGFNYQDGPLVWGAEADLAWAGVEAKDHCIAGSPVALLNCGTSTDFVGTVALRLGVVVDRALLFAKGGAAMAHVKHDAGFFAAPFTGATADSNRWGWMMGTGIEYALFGNWSAKVEYDYLDFGTEKVDFAGLPLLVAVLQPSVETKQRMHLVKLGVNYRFGQGPVVAKY